MEETAFSRLPVLGRISSRVVEPTDSEETKRTKAAYIGAMAFVVPNGLILIGLYLYFDEVAAALALTGGMVIALVAFAHFINTRQLQLSVSANLAVLLLGPFLITLALGGFVASSVIILYSAIIPVGAVALGRTQEASRWFIAALVIILVAGLIQPWLDKAANLPEQLVDPILFVLNIAAASGLAFGTLLFVVRDRDRVLGLLVDEQERSERLLLNVLPEEITPALKAEQRTIADYFSSASVLFADIVGSTRMFASMAPDELVDWLNEIFSEFDRLVERYGLEKIRTIGDNYMVASGVPRAREDHASAISHLALDMRDLVNTLPDRNGKKIVFRIGISSGPLVAGVIGETKFHYDIWGDTVNTASRMESHGVPGEIQVTRATYDLVEPEFLLDPRGEISIKGKGNMETWFLRDRRPI